MKGTVLPLRRVEGRAAEMSDQALVAACGVGDQAALSALFDRFQVPVRRFLVRIAGSAGAADLEDLVQITFVEVWRSAPRFENRSAVRSWIFGIAANVARHHFRSTLRRKNALDLFAGGHTPGEAIRPDQLAEQRQLIDQVGQALDDLPHDLRVAFVLCELEEVSGVDAASGLGVRPGTLWRRVHDARKRLRRALEEEI